MTNRLVRKLLCLAAAVLWAVTAALPVQAEPQTYTLMVDTFIDSNAAAYQICTQAANDCSLRGAISFSNRNTYNHYVLVLAPGVYALTLAGAGENENASGDLDIATDLIIQGNGASIQANLLDRVVDVHFGDLLLENLTLSGGAAPNGANGQPGTPGSSGEEGGGIRFTANDDTLTLKNCRVSANRAGGGGAGGSGGAGGAGAPGGGIYAAAQTHMSLNLTHVDANWAGSGGAGGAGQAGAPGPLAGGAGGSGGAGGDGGGIFSLGTVALDRSSISNNHAGAAGSGGAGGVGGTGDFSGGNGGSGGTGGSGGLGGGVDIVAFSATRSMFEGNSAGAGGQGGAGGHGGDANLPTGLAGNGGNGGGGGPGGGGGAVLIPSFGLPGTLLNSSLYYNLAGVGGSPGAGGIAGSGSLIQAAAGMPGTEGRGGDGGGLLNQAVMYLNFVTITQNIAGPKGAGAALAVSQGQGGGFANHATLHAMNSLIADNFRAWDGGRDDCHTLSPATPFYSRGHNLFSSNTGCTITYSSAQDRTDLFSTSPGLMAAGSYGGATRVPALTAASPAMDLAACVDWNLAVVREDQRGYARPKGVSCDSGAFERAPFSRYLPVVGD